MKISRVIYTVFAWVFLAGVVAQVFFAGMAVVARLAGWENHVNLGRLLAVPLLIMLVTAYTGRFPGRMKRLTWLLFAAYFLQADVLIYLRDSVPLLSAFHPVMALVDFALGLLLAVRATALVRGEGAQAERLQMENAAAD